MPKLRYRPGVNEQDEQEHGYVDKYYPRKEIRQPQKQPMQQQEQHVRKINGETSRNNTQNQEKRAKYKKGN